MKRLQADLLQDCCLRCRTSVHAQATRCEALKTLSLPTLKLYIFPPARTIGISLVWIRKFAFLHDHSTHYHLTLARHTTPIDPTSTTYPATLPTVDLHPKPAHLCPVLLVCTPSTYSRCTQPRMVYGHVGWCARDATVMSTPRSVYRNPFFYHC